MRSIFIGFCILLLWLPLSPFTAAWMLGERTQGRIPKWSQHAKWYDELSPAAFILVTNAIFFGIAYVAAIVYALRNAS